jgi:uncharacterized membrane protein YhhN
VRVYNRFIITLALAFSLIDVLLAVFGQKDIAIYFVADAIAYLVITLLYVYLNPRSRSALSVLSGVIFAGFMVIVVMKVIEILG